MHSWGRGAASIRAVIRESIPEERSPEFRDAQKGAREQTRKKECRRDSESVRL